jgi:hypothetical protein
MCHRKDNHIINRRHSRHRYDMNRLCQRQLSEQMLTPGSQPNYNTYNPPREQERDFYGSPVPPNSQLAPYQPDPRRPSLAYGGQPQYAPRGSQGQLMPYFAPPPRERSSSRDSRGHRHHRSGSQSHHSRPASSKGEKSDHATERGIGANLVGAAGGGYLGHKFAGGGVGTVLGALVGGYAAHQAEKKHSKHRKDKKGKKSRDSDSYSDNDEVSHGVRRRRSRHGSEPAPLGGQLYPPEPGRRRRHSRSARSRSKRRGDSGSNDSSSEDNHRRRRHHH